MIYVDTSAFLAICNPEDPSYQIALDTWKNLIEKGERLASNNYVLVESIALIQNRVGLEALSILHNDIIPFLEIEWLDESLHNGVMDQVITGNRRQISMVDYSSFATMKRHNIRTAFTFDDHFRQHGFEIIP
ncbi:MAG TPA: PIN domain-containing protein [Anaerolineales bacterium]|nr:PIN domain-containing protein [Anaerolineales bacterium]HMX20065.1 PIN domain-containing protein [Anaerolineales bacterium]HMX75016.1 PIN domain-containing protein [Anaerolineales bacterium]HMZ43803.1 PIN domain-containing protein [Anaerolineales bacterium]HNA56386.1 PIN domain-containing protein [Anaerolineales bacterium]